MAQKQIVYANLIQLVLCMFIIPVFLFLTLIIFNISPFYAFFISFFILILLFLKVTVYTLRIQYKKNTLKIKKSKYI